MCVFKYIFQPLVMMMKMMIMMMMMMMKNMNEYDAYISYMIKHMELPSNGNVARARDAAAAEFGSTTFGDVIEGPRDWAGELGKSGTFPGGFFWGRWIKLPYPLETQKL